MKKKNRYALHKVIKIQCIQSLNDRIENGLAAPPVPHIMFYIAKHTLSHGKYPTGKLIRPSAYGGG